MEKLNVVLDDQKTKTASTSEKCPSCGGRVHREDGYLKCEKCGTAPWEKQKDTP